jgi:hypothetical protein
MHSKYLSIPPNIPPELPVWKTRYNRIKHLRQRLNRANIFLFHRSDRGRKGAEKELAVDCGRRIKPLGVLVGSTGARVAASDYEGSN